MAPVHQLLAHLRPIGVMMSDRPPRNFPAALRSLVVSLERVFPAMKAAADHEASRLLLCGVLVGIVGGMAAGIFDKAMVWVGLLMLGTAEPAAVSPATWRALLGPAAAGVLAGGVIRYLTSRHRPQSVPDVMGRTQLHADSLSLREGLPSALAAALVVGGGQSGGREGPIVQVSSALASAICRIVGVPPRHFRALVAAGAAAGVAASFNSPLGGAFFALEILLGDFALDSFAPVVAATVTGTVVGQALLGERIALHLPTFTLRSPVELVLYLVLGLLAGVVAVVFKRLVVAASHAVDGLGLPLPVRTGAAGLVVGGIGAAGVNEVMGNGYVWMEQTISEPHHIGIGFLVLLVAIKSFATAVTAAGKGGAGLFAPSLFVGAATGLAFGLVANSAVPGLASSPGAYGMVGMGAVCAAVLHAPITMTLMLFEMAGNYAVILPLLLALATSGLVSARLGSESIYELELKRQGLVLPGRRSYHALSEVKVGDVMEIGHHPSVAGDTPVRLLAQHLQGQRAEVLWVVDDHGRLLGALNARDLLTCAAGATTAGDIAVRSVPHLHAYESLESSVPLFFRSAREHLPVVDADDRLEGVLSERDVIAAYHREVTGSDGLLAQVRTGAPGAHHTDFVELPFGEALEVIDVDGRMAGRTLADLQLPRNVGCTVLAMSRWNTRSGRWERTTIDPELALETGDRLVVVGPADQIGALTEATGTPS